MNGFERLKEQVKDQKDAALNEVVNYLLIRTDLEPKYLNEEKSLEGMCDFIKNKARKNAKNGWNFVTNEIVFSWAVMYFSLPDSILKIEKPKPKAKKQTNTNKASNNETKQNVVSIKEAKKKEEVKQLSLFGGAA